MTNGNFQHDFDDDDENADDDEQKERETKRERVRERVSEISIPIDDVDHQTRYMHWLKGGSSGVTDASTYTWKHMPF